MSVEPAISSSGELLYQRVLPIMGADEDNDWFGRYLSAAIMDGMLQGLDQVVLGTATHPPWCVIADPKVCPAAWLPWCGWLYGVELPPGLTPEAQRALIEELPPQKRGGIAAMALAAAPTLIGAGTAEAPQFTLVLVERAAGKAYRINAYCTPEQTPEQEAATIAALLTQKAGAIKLIYTSLSAPRWENATLEWSKVGAGVTWVGAKTGEV